MSVEQKIKELLEATAPGKTGLAAEPMAKVDGEVEDLGPAVTEPTTAKGPDAGKKVKKATAPAAGGVKEESEEDEDLESIEEVVEEGKKSEAVEIEIDGEDEDEEEDGEEEEMPKKEGWKKMKKEDLDVSEDLAALSEAISLDEELQEKAKTIFESAVLAKVNSALEEINETYATQLEEEVQTIKTELTEKVDTYLSYVVEQWAKDNELAIERGLKTEITEDFIVSLKKVFEEHYVDVPEDKYDVMAEQQSKIEELEAKLNEQIEKNAEVAKTIAEAKKESLVVEFTKDLAETQVEKFKSLVEGVNYESDEQYAKELETLKESYFPKVAKPIEEDTVASEPLVEESKLTGEMKDYVSAISRTFKAK